MIDATLYHNPRCSKSRQTLSLLQAHGLTPTIIDYLKTPPTAAELKKILKLLGLSARELMRQKEAAYQQVSETDSEAQLIQLMADNPILLERPIVIIAGQAVIGRPPENVLPLLTAATNKSDSS